MGKVLKSQSLEVLRREVADKFFLHMIGGKGQEGRGGQGTNHLHGGGNPRRLRGKAAVASYLEMTGSKM